MGMTTISLTEEVKEKMNKNRRVGESWSEFLMRRYTGEEEYVTEEEYEEVEEMVEYLDERLDKLEKTVEEEKDKKLPENPAN